MAEYRQPKDAMKFIKKDDRILAHITCPICMQLIQSQFAPPFNWMPASQEESQIIYQHLATSLNRLLVKHIHSHYGIHNWGHINIMQLEIKDPLYGHVVQLVRNRLNRMSILQRLKFLFTKKTQII